MKQKLTFITLSLFTILSFHAQDTKNTIPSDSDEPDIIFAYIPPVIQKCFLSIQGVLEENFLVENNDKNAFYDLCNLLEYDSKIINYRTALSAVQDALTILKEYYDLFSYRKVTKSSYQPMIDSLQEYKECLLNNESIVTVSSEGIRIAQSLKNTKDGSYKINLSYHDTTQLLKLFKQKLYRSPRPSNEKDLPPTDADFLNVLHVDSKSINTQDLNVCGDAKINGTLDVCGEILLNSLDLEMELEDLISCCDFHESRLDTLESEVDLLESCCDAQDSRLDILESELDVLESEIDNIIINSIVDRVARSCCDVQASRIDVLDSEVDVLESCCDAHDSRLDILESEVDILESCCDAQDSRLDIIDSKIDILESCCDAQDSRLDVIDSEIDILESCCDAQDSRLDVIDSEIDILESCCDAHDSRLDILESEVDILESCCDAQDSRLDVIDSEIDVLESCCDALDSRVDILESIVDNISVSDEFARSCCDALDSRVDILESIVDNISVSDEFARSCCDALDSRVDLLESEIDFIIINSVIDRVARSCCDAQDTRLDILESEVDVLESRFDALTNELVFTPRDMDRRLTPNPTSTFNNVYGIGALDPIIETWLMGRSSLQPTDSRRRPMSIQFKIPNDFDSNGTVEVDAHLLIDDLQGGETNETARLRLRADFKGNNEQLGTSAGGFAEDTESADFTITEPTLSSALNHQLVTITLTDSVVDAIEPRDWAYIAINRAAPMTGTEYGANIFLSTVSFRYQKK